MTAKKSKKMEEQETVVLEEEALEETEREVLDEEVQQAEQTEQESTSGGDAQTVNDMICALETEKEEFLQALQRERADFENYKKRNAELAATSYQNGSADAVIAFLPVMDNFERAMCVECTDGAFYDGMSMIMRQFADILKNLGVEEIATDGQFDPEVHHAVMQGEDESKQSNEILEVLQKGYAMKGKVLRHAMVKVNK